MGNSFGPSMESTTPWRIRPPGHNVGPGSLAPHPGPEAAERISAFRQQMVPMEADQIGTQTEMTIVRYPCCYTNRIHANACWIISGSRTDVTLLHYIGG